MANARYALNHCFTRMAKDAVLKLIIKLENHRIFMRMAATDGWKALEEGVKISAVEFRDCPQTNTGVKQRLVRNGRVWSMTPLASCLS